MLFQTCMTLFLNECKKDFQKYLSDIFSYKDNLWDAVMFVFQLHDKIICALQKIKIIQVWNDTRVSKLWQN